MHIYNILLNKSFMECLANYKDIIEKYFSVQNTMKFLDSIIFPQSSSCSFNQLNPIFQSLIQNQNNIIIEINPKKDKVIEFLSTKEFIENADKIKLEFRSIYNNKTEYKVLIIEYIKKNKLEKGYLLHFGKNTFVILKDIGNKISQKFAIIPITEYKNLKELKTEEEINNSKRSIIDIFNNQLVSNHLYGIGNIYINDNRNFNLNYGKIYIDDQKDYTEFNYIYNENNIKYTYNFICLTDGKILSGNFNLKNSFTIGTLIKKENITFEKNDKDKIKFDLAQLNINKITDLKTAIKLLGLLYMTRNILVNQKIILNINILNINNKNSINNIMSLITQHNIYNNYCFDDLYLINNFRYSNKDKIIQFEYDNKPLLIYNITNNNEVIDDSVPYDVLKEVLIYIIEHKLIKKDKKYDNFSDNRIITGFKHFDEKISNIISNLLSHNYYIINIKDNHPEINNEKFSLNCSFYISFIPETYEIYLVIGKQIYSLYLVDNSSILFIYKQNNINIINSNKLNNNIVYERSINTQYMDIKNLLNNF